MKALLGRSGKAKYPLTLIISLFYLVRQFDNFSLEFKLLLLFQEHLIDLLDLLEHFRVWN